MFEDFSSETTGFLSNWKTHKKLRENGSQTSEILTYEVQTQSRKPRHVECQTESMLDMMMSSQNNENENVDIPALIQFLRIAEPIVSKQIKINNLSSGLYRGIMKAKYGASENHIICEHVLNDKSISSQDSGIEDHGFEVTCLSWTSSGATLAVAYGTNENLAWSDQRSYIGLWNLDRSKINPNACDQKLELESCVQTISCHPELAGYIAAGLYSGLVVLWDLAKDEVIYSETSHADPVTCICWMQSSSAKYLEVLSSSTDGDMIVWKWRKGKETEPLKTEKHMKIRGANLPRRVGMKGHGSVGITSCCPMKGDPHDPTQTQTNVVAMGTVIVGCENGSVLKCSTEVNDSNPITFVYESHVGPVYSVEWSPFHRHLFLTCATEQVCRIYHSLQASPLREIRPEEAVSGRSSNYLYSVFWSTTRPAIIFAAGGSGRIEACDLRTSRCVSFCDVTSADGKPCSVNHMQSNSKRRNLFASGSKSVHVWRLGEGLVESAGNGQDEQAAIDGIANEAMTED
uniref:WD repeat-containing protein 34 n=1 Tax=Phallusia mammillata TaxID=59560 RepID=A0A6F9DXV0_9ASCI|nr:WD repeat-containing protein 34 [Phallusia mammillata]